MTEQREHLLAHEPADEFHACVLLGALNVIEGALSSQKRMLLKEMRSK